ncbi:MAG TPA: DsbA family protein [Acidimicrobiia bacterium]|nr:DsbA family protein [Acidimicrobiia bacterium]
MADVTFFFDPACPWTWRASRWLTDVAEARGLEIEWRSLSLLVLKGEPPADPVRRARLEASHRALRLVEWLRQARRQDDIARLYAEIGTLVHEGGAPFDDVLLAHAARETGVVGDGANLEAVLGDDALDEAVKASTEAAIAAAGPGVGSPVLVLAGAERGLHGPVLGAVPAKRESLALWDAVEALAPIGSFFEIKRGRR